MVGKKRKSRSHCFLIHRFLFSSSIPKLSYTRVLNSASIAARVLGFVVEGKRCSVEPSVPCSCGLAPFILPKSVNLKVGKQCKSRSHCWIHRLLFSSSIPKLSYTRILNSASIAARALGFVVEGKRRSVEPSVVACSCGLAPLCFDGLHLLPSEQPAIQGKK